MAVIQRIVNFPVIEISYFNGLTNLVPPSPSHVKMEIVLLSEMSWAYQFETMNRYLCHIYAVSLFLVSLRIARYNIV
jgi:hypothetical protein